MRLRQIITTANPAALIAATLGGGLAVAVGVLLAGPVSRIIAPMPALILGWF